MQNHTLSDREELVLRAVVHLYILTAEPVGSRAVVKRFELDISPATVRNVMADLEEMNYLQQLHTSSGRVPTDAGYRYYVDYLMHVQEVTQAERSRLEADLAGSLQGADEIIRQTGHLLALISHQTSIVESPHPERAELRRIEILPLDNERLVLLLADNYGRVRTVVTSISDHFLNDDTERLARFMNDALLGTPVEDLSRVLQSKMTQYLDEQRRLAESALKVVEALPLTREDQLVLDGAAQLFEQPEFRDVDKAREVFGLLEERERVMELLRAGIETQERHSSRVVIGSEAAQHGMDTISVVSAPYNIAGEPAGMLGVLGPRRMSYSRMTGVVEYTASLLSRLLTRMAS